MKQDTNKKQKSNRKKTNSVIKRVRKKLEQLKIKFNKKTIMIIIGINVLIIILFVAVSVRRGSDNRGGNPNNQGGDQSQQVNKELAQVMRAVSEHIVLPENEEPVLATISDVNKLQESSSFYDNAKNGDKILIYVKSNKAYIYNPDQKRLVNVGQVFDPKKAIEQEEELPREE